MKTKKNFLKKLTAVALGFVMTLGVGAAGYAASASETHAEDVVVSIVQGQTSVTSGGITFSINDSVGAGYSPWRLYGNKEITISSSTVTFNKIVFTTTSGSFTGSFSVGSINDKTWSNSTAVDSVTYTHPNGAAQVRISQITVTTVSSGDDPEPEDLKAGNYTATINKDSLGSWGSGYQSGNFTVEATHSDGTKASLDFYGNRLIKNSNNIQFDKTSSNQGYLYNKTDLGTITEVTLNNKSSNVFSTFYGTSEHPTSGSTVGNGFFTVKTTATSGTNTIGSITLKFTVGAPTPATGYTINFDANGGTGTQTKLTNESAASFELPTTTTFTAPNEEKMFDGWSETKDGAKITQNPYTPTMSAGGSKTLYARWADKQYDNIPGGEYSVDYIAGDHRNGSYTIQNIKLAITPDTAGKCYKPLKVDFTASDILVKEYNSHYELAMYYSYDEGFTISTESNATITTIVVDQGNSSYSVSTDSSGTSGGTGATSFGSRYTYDVNGKSVTIMATSGQAYIYSVKVNLYVSQPYDVTFNGNGADTSWTNPAVTQTPDANYVLPNSNPTKEGYTFGGWWTASTGGTQITSSTKVPRTSIETAYAHWSINTYNVVYKPGTNCKESSTYNATKTYGSALELRGLTYTRDGYKQTGWTTADCGTTKSYELGGSYTNNAAIDLYPYWEAKQAIQLTADDLELDLFIDAENGKTPSNPNQSGITYTVVDTSVATYNGSTGKFYPAAVGETSVTMSKAEDTDHVYTNGSFKITVSARARLFTVSKTGTNCTISGSDSIYENDEEVYTITASSGYKLPDSVSLGGATVKSYVKSSYSAATLTIHEAYENVSLSVTATAIETYNVSYTGSNYTHSDVATITEFTSESITLTPAEGYKLPTDVTVTGATKVSYSSSTGALTISNPTGAVTINCVADALANYTITVTGAGDYSSKFTKSGATNILESRSATVTISPAAVEEGDPGHYEIPAANITVVGATKGSYTDDVLTISNPTGNVTITVTPIYKVIRSIRVTTNPTKMSYKIGETFSSSGILVTGYYDTNATQSAGDITNECSISLADPEAMLKAGHPVVSVVHTPTGVTLDDAHQLTITVEAIPVTVTKVWTKASSLGAGNYLIVTHDNSGNYYYLPTANTTSTGTPSQHKITLTNTTVSGVTGKTIKEGNVEVSSDNIWTIEKTSETATTYFIHKGSDYLYTTSDNNGVRVYTTTSSTQGDEWTLGSDNSLKNDRGRYVGVYTSGDNWRCYTSKHSNLSGSESNYEFYSLTEVPSGTPKLAGLTASYIRSAENPHAIGENVTKADLSVKAWFDDGSTEINPEDYVITNPSLQSTSNNVILSYTVGTVTKTCTVVVPAVQIEKQVEDVWIETETGYKTNYIKDGNNPLSWDLSHIKARIYWDDQTTSLMDAADLANLQLNPAAPSIGAEQFTISGSYLGVSVNAQHNAVTGISVVAKGISSFGTWNLSESGSGFKWAYYVGEKLDIAHLGTCKPTWNDGTSSATTVSVESLIRSGEASLGLFEQFSEKGTPNVTINKDNIDTFVFEAGHDGYKMALISEYTRSRKDTLFTVYSFDQDELNAVSSNIGMAYKYTDNGENPPKGWVRYDGTQTIGDGTQMVLVSKYVDSDTVTHYYAAKPAYADSKYLVGEDEVNLTTLNFSGNMIWTVSNYDNSDSTFKLGSTYNSSNVYLNPTKGKTDCNVTTSGGATLSIVKSGDNYGVSTDTSRLVMYRASGDFRNYSTSNINKDDYANETYIYIYTESSRYTNVDFRFKLEFNGLNSFAANNTGFAEDYGLKVTYNDKVLFFSALKQGIYNSDGTKVTDLQYIVTSADSGYFVLKLGDVINDLDKASTVFTIQPYVVGGGNTYYSSSISSFSVMSIVEHYHNDPATAKAASVVALYKIFFGEEE